MFFSFYYGPPTVSAMLFSERIAKKEDEAAREKISKALDEVVEWKPPGPPKKTGKHRYVFLVFAPQNGTTLPLNLSKPKERKHWGTGEERKGVRDWAKDNGLVPVGKVSHQLRQINDPETNSHEVQTSSTPRIKSSR